MIDYSRSEYGSKYTGWPRKNATTLIINFKDIVNKTDLFSISISILGKAFGY